MAMLESGLTRPNWLRRMGQEHTRVFFFSLGKIARAPLAAALSALVIGIALALPAGLYVLTQNLAQVGYSWQSSLQISVFLKDSVGPEAGTALAQQIGSDRLVAGTRYISREQSLAEFRAQSGFGEALDILKDNPLPAVIVVTPQAQASQKEVEQLGARLNALPEADAAKLDQKWLLRLHALLDIGQRVVSILTVLLGLAVMVIIGNTVRLDVEARREEIEVMKLIGAPDSFIRRPFLYAGFWYGLAGGLLAWALVAGTVLILSGPAGELAQAYGSGFIASGLPWRDGLALLATGVLLGWASAWIAVTRRLIAIEPR
ncbi:cell division transport system permease protein [Solimonas aquatica]|uniref:Cell division protein FtsX n=1 Tax=Solimonas aquatica TaxID=489703 RepID=A0A1H9BSE1_9GAMM|nr:permease-like cell division protein FtsX [Solimonas aquatica]SEP91631.1 cell division transport system permease protein [Solimonas aquatica]